MTDKSSLSQDQQQYYDAAKSLLDKDKLKSLLFRLTDIHSPTGSTQAACSMLVEHIRDTLSVDAKVMSMAGESAAGYARLKGEGGGANLLLYAPIDTHLEGDESDMPWVGPKVTADLLPEAKMVDDWVLVWARPIPRPWWRRWRRCFDVFERPMCRFLAICLSGLPMEACRSPFQSGGMQVCRTVSCIY